MRILFPTLPFALVATCLSCDNYDCTTDVPHGPFVEVLVLDARTRLPAADGVQGYLYNAEYADKLTVCRTDGHGVAITLCGGFKAAGTYTVVLNKPGYHQWTNTSVRVPVERCGLGVAQVTAELVPLEEQLPTASSQQGKR